MRHLFGILSMFDWISPMVGMVQCVINDPTPLQSNTYTFFVPYGQALNAGWNANKITGLLAQHGIKTWGAQYIYPQDEWFFNIKYEQENWAAYILGKYGVPTKSPNSKIVDKIVSWFV